MLISPKTIRLCVLTALAALLASTSLTQAQPLHEGVDYEKFITERDEIAGEFAEWLRVYGKNAAKNGWLPAPTTSESVLSESEATEDHLQRFFLAKQRVKKLSLRMPEVEFSVMSPFSLLTEGEFKAVVGPDHSSQRLPLRTRIGRDT